MPNKQEYCSDHHTSAFIHRAYEAKLESQNTEFPSGTGSKMGSIYDNHSLLLNTYKVPLKGSIIRWT